MRMADSDSDEGGTMQMTTFMDTMFIMVIFLMVVAVLKKVHHELDIDLPDKGIAAKQSKTLDMTRIISVTRDGRYYVGEKEVTRNKLLDAVAELASEKPGTKVRIDADRAARMEYVVYVLDVCEFYGLNDIGVRTRD